MITLHAAEDIELARAAGHAAAQVLAMIGPYVRAGVTTEELDRRCHDYIVRELGLTPANIGYHGYAHTLCTSVNHVICHGIPDNRALQEGDIVNVDVAVIKEGWYGDTSRMYFVGEPSIQARQLVEVTYKAMVAGIRAVRPGARLGDVGSAIQQVAEKAGFSVVRDYCGHGIGRVYHDTPDVLHYGRQGTGMCLKPGMIFTIEPMINAGKADADVLSDDWTVVTLDGSLSAQWEHTIAVTDTGFDLLTPWPDGTRHFPPV